MRKTLLAPLSLILLLALSFQAQPVAALNAHPEAPRTLNYYLRTDLEGREQLLSKWDLMVVPHQVIDEQAGSLAQIRLLNPDQITLAYIDPFQVPANPSQTPGHIQHDFVEGIAPEWYAYNTAGEVISVWENSLHVNYTSACPVVGGLTYRDYFVDFVESRLLSLIDQGIIDGVFLDEMSNGGYLWWQDQIDEFQGYDYDNDGLADDPDQIGIWMNEALLYLSDTLGNALPAEGHLMGNNCKPYLPGLGGKLFEAFPGNWENYIPGSLLDLDTWNSLETGPDITSINGVWWNLGDARHFRYRFSASLLGDTYFSYDASTSDHHQIYWYDLFDFNLGLPLGQRYTIGETPLMLSDFESGMGSFVQPFTPHSAVSVTSEPGLVIQGESSLLAEVTSADAWPTLFFVTVPGGYLPGETYTFSFRYRILEAAQPDIRLFFKSSPEGLSSTVLRAMQGAEGLYRAALTLGEAEAPEIRLLVESAFSIVIDSLSVVQGDGGLWARDYEHGAVVCNASGGDLFLPHDSDWELVDANSQPDQYPDWAFGIGVTIQYEDGLVFRNTDGATGAPPLAPGLSRVALGAPWPNPFNPRFSVTLGGTAGAEAVLTLHDVRGRRLAELWRGVLEGSGQRLSFDLDRALSESLPSGVYLLRAATSADRTQCKLVLLR